MDKIKLTKVKPERVYIYKDQLPEKVKSPYILPEDRAEILQRYRKYIVDFNNKVDTLNEKVIAYNFHVKCFIKEHSLEQQAKIATFNFNEQQKCNKTKNKW